ncbi:NEL domain-containing protein [Pseudomonas sp. PGPR40]|uniref:NEL domain-containing protein n=1 Tax=Pseudomonas sp. PGPR40 TaxID=2913476 RepID=UPI001EDB323D|nr:NEL domain-containing protein [Pseudomonas sp. PGPR40]
MPELQGSNPTGSSSPATKEDNGVHHQRIKPLIPKAITEAPRARLLTAVDIQPTFPDWYLKARPADRAYLKQLIDERWRLQGRLDELLGDLQHDIKAFAEPLLKTLLLSNFNEHGNPNDLQLRLYVPNKIAGFIDNQVSTLRHSTLLEAALHNFEEDETGDDAFRNGSAVLRKDFRGDLHENKVITPQKWATLCRRLDIGGQYQTHIKSLLTPADADAARLLKERSIASDKAALKLASMTAYLKGDIGLHGYATIGELIDGKSDILWHGHPLHSHRLSLMGCRMTSVVLFSAVAEPMAVKKAIDGLMPDARNQWLDFSQRATSSLPNGFDTFRLLKAFFANGPKGVMEEMLRKDEIYRQNRLSGPLIAWVPDDPDHPLKEYASLTDFMKTLIGQLRESDYQEFFSRFVAQKDKAIFFSRVNERLKTITWQQREPLDMGPWWRETAVENPDAQPVTHLISDELWDRLFRERRDKAIADARLIAVPTDDEDANARWKRLSGYLDIAWNLFNFGAMLVPVLGPAMLGLMAAQLMTELVEGIEDWSKGDVEEGAAHINSVLINGAQLALMFMGHVLPKGPTPIRPSPLIDSLKPVELPGGKTRLIKPDHAPYEHRLTLPEAATPDELGVIEHDGRKVLSLEGKQFVLQEDPLTGQPRLQHPKRPDAYQPNIEHNGAGAWRTEFEKPMEWDKGKLLRRLGPSVEGISDEVLEQVRHVSGVDEGVLRRMHVENEPSAPLLMDTLKRFKAYADADKLSAQILNGQVPQELSEKVTGFVTALHGWPESRALVLEADAASGRPSLSFGATEATPENTLNISRSDVCEGRLPTRVVDTLSEAQLQDWFGSEVPKERSARIAELQKRIARQAQDSKKILFDTLYEARETTSDARINLLKRDFPDLSNAAAQALLDDATEAGLLKLTHDRRIPLCLREMARKSVFGLRLSRAYEGLYLDELSNADTGRLVLHTLENWSKWPKDMRLDVRDFSFTGALHDSVGPVDASVRKVLVMREDGHYETFDHEGGHLQGAQLRQAVKQAPLSHDTFSKTLLDHPIRKPAYDPQIMRLRGGMRAYRMYPQDTDLSRIRTRSLYPDLDDSQVQALLNELGDLADQRLTTLEIEFNRLNESMQRWVNQPAPSWLSRADGISAWKSRNDIYVKLRRCWQRTGPPGVEAPGIVAPQALNLDGFPLDRHLATMPELAANFDHVTELSLNNVRLRDEHVRFLRPFRQLRQLKMTQNGLTVFPQEIGNMRRLTHLLLNDNNISLDSEGTAHLRGLTRLRLLRLNNNPLRLPPDVSRMPNLQAITLDHGQLNTWPTGYLDRNRPRSIYLNLEFNRLTHIPEVAPGSFRAELLARTLFTRDPDWISPQNLERMRMYIESLGLDPDRAYPPRGVLDSSEWGEGLSNAEWNAKQEIWDNVEDEYGSLPFFNEIRRLTESYDFKADDKTYRIELTTKVWRMLEAMAERTELREKLFAEATSTTNCVDGGTQLFNAMGVEVLVHEARSLANPGLVEAELLQLARGKARLDELGRIARERVAERLRAGETFYRPGTDGGTIDEVEVHLAYMTDLAERLDLPWQARGMQFRTISKVTKEMIEAACQRVLALEEGDLLTERILEQPIWQTFMETTYRQEFDALKLRLENAEDEEVFQAIKDLERTLTRQALNRARLDKVNTKIGS